MKKILIISLLTITLFALTGCGKKDAIKTCPNCVFSYYTYLEEKDIGDVLTDYTSDYKTLKDENGLQRQYFLGHVIDKNKKITKSYVCGILNEEAFCLQGTDGTKNKDIYPKNQDILKKLYGSEKCSEASYFTSCNGNIESSTYTNGNVIIGKCSVRSSTICSSECKPALKTECTK